MAGENETDPRAAGLIDALEREPWSFDFFQALRRIESALPGKARLGASARPVDDPLRLGQEPSLAFAPSTVASFDPGDESSPPRLTVRYPGLLGPSGPMPLHFTEYVRTRSRAAQDPSLARFLDVFHHRMLSLFYRAWALSRPTVARDRPREDRFASWVGSTFGQGSAAFRDRDAAPDDAKRYYAGHLARQTRNAAGLVSILADFFGVGAEVRPFRGSWLEIPEKARWRLGETPETGTLGVSTTAGGRTWERHLSFRVVLGPLSREEYERFLPGGRSLARLDALVRNYVGDELDYDVRLVLAREETPRFVLGGDTRLGITTWVIARPPESDPADLVLRPAAARA